MSASGQRRSLSRSKTVLYSQLVCLAAIFFVMNGSLRGQSASQLSPSDILGQIIGDDISVLGPSQAISSGTEHAIAFSGGSTVVVHSGKARLQFSGGGELDICGPAKFTVLSSGEALTIALSFGRLHLRVDAARPITIYSPLILATPISISEQPRDATIGLATTGTMCVLATHGAVHLQNQLSGESMIVPQPSEVLLAGSSLGNLPTAAGQCRCDFDEPAARNAPPQQTSFASPIQEAPRSTPDSRSAQISPASNHAQITAQGETQSESKNVTVPPAASSLSAPRSIANPNLKITLPPIGYDAKNPLPVSEPLSVATLMLAKETVVQPQWIFHGLVIEPEKRKKSETRNKATSTQTPLHSEQLGKTSRQSFWTKLRHFLFGRPAVHGSIGHT